MVICWGVFHSMGIPDSSLLDLLGKVKSWISWGASDLSPSCLSCEFEMPNNGVRMCCECDTNFAGFFNGFHCQSCGKWLCAKCMKGYQCPPVVVESNGVKSNDCSGKTLNTCKFCNEVSVKREGGRKNSEKVHPSESPRESPEPPSPSFSGESIHSDHLVQYLQSRVCGYSPLAVTSRSMISSIAHPSSFLQSPSR